MRIYDAATVVEERLTGFQSPCSEFAEKPLSLDEKYGLGDPGLLLLKVEHSCPQHGIFKGDELLVDLSRRPRPQSLVVIFQDDEMKILKGNHHQHLDDVQCAVVRVIIRSFEA